MKHVIGIDPSLTRTAVCCLYEDGTHEMVTLKSPPPHEKSLTSRIWRFAKHAQNIGEVIRAGAELILLEGYSYGSKGSSVITLGEFGGVLRNQLSLQGSLSLTREVSPSTLKQFVLGKGVGDKDQISAHLTHHYGVLLNNNDEYDAYGLAKLAACVVGWDDPANGGQRKAVATIRAAK
jgi:Holliday junction resolvasome RuvABC endonuclease subunit